MADARSYRRIETGIVEIHTAACKTASGGRCSCARAYRATIPLGERGRSKAKRFSSLDAARTWRAIEIPKARRYAADNPEGAPTISEAIDAFVDAASAGDFRQRGGATYAPGTIVDIRLKATPFAQVVGDRPVSAITPADVERFIVRVRRDGKSSSTIRSSVFAVSTVYRYAKRRGWVVDNPTRGVDLPTANGRRERFATREEYAALVVAVPVTYRVVYAIAGYAGLRHQEIRDLRWCDIDERDDGSIVIRVRASKTNAGVRLVPAPSQLAPFLAGQRERAPHGPDDPIRSPWGASKMQAAADEAWSAAGLHRITPHECRHTYASLMAQAGVRIIDLSVFMGHASITTTIDLYRHLYDEARTEASTLLSAYLGAPTPNGPTAVKP